MNSTYFGAFMKKLAFLFAIPFAIVAAMIVTCGLVTFKIASLVCGMFLFQTGEIFFMNSIHKTFENGMKWLDAIEIGAGFETPYNVLAEKKKTALNMQDEILEKVRDHHKKNPEIAEEIQQEFAVSFFTDQWKHLGTVCLHAHCKSCAVEHAKATVSKHFDVNKAKNIEAEIV